MSLLRAFLGDPHQCLFLPSSEMVVVHRLGGYGLGLITDSSKAALYAQSPFSSPLKLNVCILWCHIHSETMNTATSQRGYSRGWGVEGTENIRKRHVSEYVILSRQHRVHSGKGAQSSSPPSPHRGLDLSIVSNTLVTGMALDPGTTPLVAVSSLPSLPAASTALRVTFDDLFILCSLNAPGCPGPR